MAFKYKDRESEYKREWARKNSERIKKSAHERYLKNKEKRSDYTKEWVRNNPESRRAIMRRYRDNNKEKLKESDRKYRKDNSVKVNEYQRNYHASKKDIRYSYFRKWYLANRIHRDAYTAERRAAKKTATPPWVDRKAVRAIYRKARRLGLTVDHIIPLRHPLVCGLHAPCNFQFLSFEENSRKTNKFEIDDAH